MKATLIIFLLGCLLGCGGGKAEIDYGMNGPEARAAIEAAIREELKKPDGEITKDDLEKISRLHISLDFDEITDVTPLAGFTQLEDLWVGGKVTDIRALAGLTKLKRLTIWGNQLSDISAIARLTKLESLFISGLYVNDISALARLTQLKSLTLGHSQIEDISALAKLKKLENLSFRYTQILGIRALAELTKLESLELTSVGITNDQLRHLRRLKNLKELWLPANHFSDLSALKGLNELQTLNLSNNPNIILADVEELQSALPGCFIKSNAEDVIFRPSTSVDEIRRLVLGKTKTEVKALFRRRPDRVFAGLWTYNLRAYNYDAERFSHAITLQFFSGPGGRCGSVDFDLVN
jgi:hypothetical protein